MVQTKEQVLASQPVSNQQALVNILTAKGKAKPVRHIIPGGKHMFDENTGMTARQLEQAIYTWIRKVSRFDECTLGFTKEPSRYQTKSIRVIDFPTNGPIVWNDPDKGKPYLAKILADKINEGKGLISLTIKRDGMYVSEDASNSLGPESEDWEPYVEFVRTKKLD